MTIYLAIAYRWGHTNDHWYFLYCGEDESKAAALAENERDGRGGKYGVAVYTVDTNGEALSMHAYYPSRDEAEPFMNWKIEMVERLGHLLWDCLEGRMMVPSPEDPRTLVHIDAPELPQVLVERGNELKRQAQTLADAFNRSRDEARARAAQVHCPICDEGPVYLVDYSCSFALVPRDETSREIEVDGLQGSWCRNCEQLHLTPEQVNANQAKIWMARHKAATAELEST